MNGFAPSNAFPGPLTGPGRIPRLCCLLGLVLISGAAAATPAASQTGRIDWQRLEPGLDLARVATPIKAARGKSELTILRADMRRFDLRLVSASWTGDETRTARDWARRQKLVAAINAGLFMKDGKTSVGLMRAGRRVNNPSLNRWGAVLSFDRRSGRIARARIFDRRCENYNALRRRYRSHLQSFRMLTCRGTPTFRPSERRWSIAALATDRRGRILFLFAEGAFSPWEFSQNLRRLPLGVKRAMYLEGSSDAQFYAKAGRTEISLVGRCSRIFGCSSGKVSATRIPNVLGLVRRN